MRSQTRIGEIGVATVALATVGNYSDFRSISLSVVMPAHSASKMRVNGLVSRASTSCFRRAAAKKDVDGRDKPGHDVER
jgi:hypothetical protein